MKPLARVDSITLGELRKQLSEMNNIELVRFCRVCSQKLNSGETQSQTLIELEEAEAEWHRRQQRSLGLL
jgi:hypothetical protein